jgi:hypothetical protein
MSRFVVTLTMDEVREARRFAKKRGDSGPMAAIGEKVIALGCRRRWEGAFQNVDKWDVWKRIGRTASAVEVRMTESVVGSLEVEDGTADDLALVLIGKSEQPRFVIMGWAFAGDAQKQRFWREDARKFVMALGDLRSPWELRKARRGKGRRLNPNDPADDFAGYGAWPMMLDTDDGKHPKNYGNIIRSKWALPCRRCQTTIPAGALTGGNMRTGNIHGDPSECKFVPDRED